MSQNDYVSSVKTIPYAQDTVYTYLSDMRNLERIKQRLSDPSVKERIQQMASQHNVGDIEEKLDKITFTQDTLSIAGSPVGGLSLKIVERETPKTIKMQGEGTPVGVNMWIQLLPVDNLSCKMRVTLRADLNMFLRGMVGKHLQQAVENIASTLSSLPYDTL